MKLAIPELLINSVFQHNLEEENRDDGKAFAINSGTLSASRTLTNQNRKSSQNTNHPLTADTKPLTRSGNVTSLITAINTLSLNLAPGDSPAVTSLLSHSATRLLLVQLMSQWKENRNQIDELMKKSQALSKIIQESIDPNEVIVKVF